MIEAAIFHQRKLIDHQTIIIMQVKLQADSVMRDQTAQIFGALHRREVVELISMAHHVAEITMRKKKLIGNHRTSIPPQTKDLTTEVKTRLIHSRLLMIAAGILEIATMTNDNRLMIGMSSTLELVMNKEVA